MSILRRVCKSSTRSQATQVVNHLMLLFFSGKILEGEPLPQIKFLKRCLGCTEATMDAALLTLELQGIIYSVDGMNPRYYFRKGLNQRARKEFLLRLAVNLYESVSEALHGGLEPEDMEAITKMTIEAGEPLYSPMPTSILNYFDRKYPDSYSRPEWLPR